MRIAAIEPYAAPSHMAFLGGLRANSRHELVLFSLPPRSWKWRMRTASLHFAEVLTEAPGDFDLLLVSDFLALAELRALLPRALSHVPAVALFHENQLTYPLQPGESRDNQYALTHLHTLLASECSVFFSEYHRRSLFEAFPKLLRHAPDIDWRPWLDKARERSLVLPLGTDAPLQTRLTSPVEEPIVLWNHRWEYDKDPERFVDAILALAKLDQRFRVRSLGERFREGDGERSRLARGLGTRLEDLGYLAERGDYFAALASAHIHVSTARHEFFGLASLEAIRAGLLPVWPRDLAYPELLPKNLRGDDRFSFLPSMGPQRALAGAIEALRSGAWAAERKDIQAHSAGYSWSHIAPRFDDLLENVKLSTGDAAP